MHMWKLLNQKLPAKVFWFKDTDYIEKASANSVELELKRIWLHLFVACRNYRHYYKKRRYGSRDFQNILKVLDDDNNNNS